MLPALKPRAGDNNPLFRFSPIYSAVSLAFLMLPVHAQTVTSVANGQWDATATWSNGLAPSASFDYVIGSGSTVNSPPANFGTFSYAFDGGSLTVQDGGTLSLPGNNNSTIGNVTYSIPGLTINSGGTLALSMQSVGNTDRTLTTGLTLAGPGTVSISPIGGTYANGLTLAPTAALSGSANVNMTMPVGGVFNRKYLRVSSANNTYSGNWNITSTGTQATGDARGALYANAANALGTGSVTLSSSMLINEVTDGLNSISGVNVGVNSVVLVNADWIAPTATLALTAPTAQVTVDGANTVMNIGNLTGVAGSSITGTGTGEILGLSTTADSLYAGTIGGTLSLLKTGANTLTLTGNNTYSGSTTVNAGTLQIGNGTTGSITTDITNNAALVFNNNSDYTYNNVLSGTGSLTKLGSGMLTFTGDPSSQGSVTVSQGTLQLLQNQPFTIAGDYTTEAGATTNIGQINSTLRVGGAFVQAAGSILNITLGSSPDIVAQSAILGGTLLIRGFSNDLVPVKASDVLNDNEYTMLRTTDGITDNLENTPLTPSGLDYLLYNGRVSGLDYNLGFQLAWSEGGVADGTGTFTMATNTAFDIDVALGDQVGTFDSGWDGKSLTKKDDGLLILSAANTYTGSTTIEDGTLALIGAADISTSSSTNLTQSGATLSIAEVSGNGASVQNLSGVSGSQLLLAGKTFTVTNSVDTTFAGDIDASNAGLIKNGEASLTLSGKTAYTGQTQIDGGTLVLDGSTGGAQLTSNVVGQSGTQLSFVNGASLTGSIDPTDVSIDTTSQWNMTGNSLVDNLSNSGTVTFMAPTADDFKTLTVAGNYQGNNGLLVLNTRLGSNASLTDKLVVEGNTSGTTLVQINNAGGIGAQALQGIEVITVGGQSDGEFVQSGRIAAGAYDYTLSRGLNALTAANWYLISNNLEPNQLTERPEGGAYSANLAAANNMFVTSIHDRLGETQYIDVLTGEQKVTSMWLRNEGGHNRSRTQSGQANTQANRYVVQLGGDIAQWSNNGLDRFHLGLMAGYGNSKSNTVSRLSGYDAKGSVNGYSVGTYGTWYANAVDKSGLYVDGWAQYSWFNNNVNGQSLVSEDYKSKGITASVESGYTFKLGENVANNMSYFIQPKAQLTWMGVKADDHTETNGSNISGEGDGNIQTRLGVKAFLNGYNDQDKGKDRVFQPFVETNWVHNSKDFGVNMNGVSVNQDGAANIAELKVGVEGQLNKQVNLWGNIGQQVGNKGYSDTAVMLGGKYNF
ncbi:autotransporter outer membrane beta-barrel domain-containing protein [Serratia sp. UGAL515B_01]|uniref:autotransporter outer membrane beta-barrel domain-containing protein n=1 Tax=Serratia sp. UGAL515B_01 TaxID=2986763 RepID=UPI002954A137|nr:autotransporter outer membrane beta-barrel domain-containing protein [Serratia sp. UGAL515B_01]WON77075.1 autotransporter outer membrane beta-barrel domain-containing protein [Serratia sp. UGAL515B_01]